MRQGQGQDAAMAPGETPALAGCVDAEMRVILHEQAGFATNPRERREEIEGLLRDHNVIAARCAA